MALAFPVSAFLKRRVALEALKGRFTVLLSHARRMSDTADTQVGQGVGGRGGPPPKFCGGTEALERRSMESRENTAPPEGPPGEEGGEWGPGLCRRVMESKEWYRRWEGAEGGEVGRLNSTSATLSIEVHSTSWIPTILCPQMGSSLRWGPREGGRGATAVPAPGVKGGARRSVGERGQTGEIPGRPKSPSIMPSDPTPPSASTNAELKRRRGEATSSGNASRAACSKENISPHPARAKARTTGSLSSSDTSPPTIAIAHPTVDTVWRANGLIS